MYKNQRNQNSKQVFLECEEKLLFREAGYIFQRVGSVQFIFYDHLLCNEVN